MFLPGMTSNETSSQPSTSPALAMREEEINPLNLRAPMETSTIILSSTLCTITFPYTISIAVTLCSSAAE